MASVTNELRTQTAKPDMPPIESWVFPVGSMTNDLSVQLWAPEPDSPTEPGREQGRERVFICKTGISILSLEGSCKDGDKGSSPCPA